MHKYIFPRSLLLAAALTVSVCTASHAESTSWGDILAQSSMLAPGSANGLPLPNTVPYKTGTTLIVPQMRLDGSETTLMKLTIDMDGTWSADVSEIPRFVGERVDAGFDPTDADTLSCILQKVSDYITTDDAIPGLAMRVDINGSSWRGVVGNSRRATEQPRLYSDSFRIGSISKVFTGTMILLLEQDGLLNLDDTMESWFSGESWYANMPNGNQITVRQLLQHQSGLYNYTNNATLNRTMYVEPLHSYTPEDLLAVSFAGLATTPGDSPAYTNTGLILAGLLIEKITQKPAEQAIRDRILVPLGLTNTMSGDDPDMPFPYAHGYAAVFDDADAVYTFEDTSYFDPSVAWTAGMQISNIDDLVTAFKCQVSNSADCPVQLLTAATLAERNSYVHTPLYGENVGYGLSVMDVCGIPYHVGAIPGYDSVVFYASDLNGKGPVSIAISNNAYPQKQGIINTYSAIETSWIAMQVITELFPGNCNLKHYPLGQCGTTPLASETREMAPWANMQGFTEAVLGIEPGRIGF